MMKLELSDGTWELKRKTSKANEREREKLVRFLIPPLLPCALVQPWRSYASRSAYRLQVQEVSSNCFIISTPLNCSGSLAYNNVLCGLFFFLPTSFSFLFRALQAPEPDTHLFCCLLVHIKITRGEFKMIQQKINN